MRSSGLFTIAALVVAVALAAVPGARADDIPEEILGTYRFSGGNSQRQALTREIDRVADQFGFLIRGIARGRMHSEIRPEVSITIERHNGGVQLRLDERRPIPCDGAWHPAQGANDEVGTGMCHYENGQLRYAEHYDEGRSYHAFSLASEGQALRVNIRITHPQLPDTVRYRLSYRRR